MNLSDCIIKNNQSTGITIPYMIAEAGVNHEGRIDLAKRLIEEAAEAGADAIKFQTYKADTIAIKDSPAYWDLSMEPTTSQHNLFKKYDKFWKDEFEELSTYCQNIGIDFLSTPFDIESANFLAPLMKAFKISSSDINNKPFIKYLCKFNKPIILSTGASHTWEVERAVSWIEDCNCSVALLHCILNYPTADCNANLMAIKDLQIKFPKNTIGYSDHTLPKDMKTLEVATLLGAKIIEKHFTFDKSLPGNDHYHSMDKFDLMKFYKRMDSLAEILGDEKKRPLESEANSRLYARRSLVSAVNIYSGDVINHSHLTWKRPGIGIEPSDIDSLIGKIAAVNIPADTALQWDMFKYSL